MSKAKNNKNLLIGLLIAAIVVSFAGTVYVAQIMKGTGVSSWSPSGAATAVTSVSVTGAATDIFVDTSTVQFGTLQRLSKNQTSDASGVTPSSVLIQNNGSVNLNISINFSADLFPESDVSIASFSYNCTQNEAAAAVCTDPPGTNHVDAAAFAATTFLASTLLSDPVADTIKLHLSVSVPDNASGGQKSITVTILSVQSN